jgi:uncharacterized protein (TIGR02594 family)
MLRMVAFCRPLVAALALCTAAIAVSATSASARPYHRSVHRAHAYVSHQVRWHNVQNYSRQHYRYARRETPQVLSPGYAFAAATAASTKRVIRYKSRTSLRRAIRQTPREQIVVATRPRGFVESSAVPNTGGVTFEDVAPFESGLVAEARRYLGGNPTDRGSLWCARFMNMVLQHTGHRGTGSDMANSFANYGTRVSGPQVGAIAVMTRGRSGGHVGIITGIDASGNPIMISGNNRNRVREAPVSRGRIYAYVMPAS